MKKLFASVLAMFGLSSPAFAAAPSIDFTAWGAHATFNSSAYDNLTYAGVGISGFVYNSGSYVQNEGRLWMRDNPDDHGLGYCSEGLSACTGSSSSPYNYGVDGRGDWNELGNNYRNEIIRLTRPDDQVWSDIWVSSLDDGGTAGNETGTFYWSNSATPTLSGGIVFSHDSLFVSSSVVEGSIFNHLVSNGFDVNAKYVFFRAGSFDASGNALNGTNNDYLVYGVGVTPVPEPEIYAMMGIGLALMGFVARRRTGTRRNSGGAQTSVPIINRAF